MRSTHEVPFLWKCQSLMSNPFKEMICLLFFGTNQRTAEKSGAIYTERTQFPKGGSPGAGAKDRNGEGKRKEKPKKGPFYFLKRQQNST